MDILLSKQYSNTVRSSSATGYNTGTGYTRAPRQSEMRLLLHARLLLLFTTLLSMSFSLSLSLSTLRLSVSRSRSRSLFRSVSQSIPLLLSLSPRPRRPTYDYKSNNDYSTSSSMSISMADSDSDSDSLAAVSPTHSHSLSSAFFSARRHLLRQQQQHHSLNTETHTQNHRERKTETQTATLALKDTDTEIETAETVPVSPSPRGKDRSTGAFKHWPTAFPAELHYRRAYRRAMKTVRRDESKTRNVRNVQRKYSAQLFDTAMKALTMPITESIELYQRHFKDLHPFEATVANLTVTARAKAGHYDLPLILSELKVLRAMTSKIAKEYASTCNNAASATEIKTLTDEGFAKLENIYLTSNEAKALSELTDLHKDLRRIPVIDLDIPAIVLVGSPNVGKSSIVRAVSSGTPEVNDYPFTTRGVTIGHIIYNNPFPRKYQVMDTPGLLDRPDEERNEMERLTFASLAHLPTAVIYVIDPTGLSGDKSTLQAQLNVRKYLKSRFPRRPWVDVVSKGDLEISEEVRALLPEQYLQISVNNGMNVERLKDKMVDMLESLRIMLENRNNQ